MWNAVAVFVVVYFVVCAVAFAIQRSVLFQPRNASAAGPLTPWTEHGQVIGYCREVDQPKTVWLMMHGNAGQASDRDYVLEVISPSDSLYVLEYPGYGNRPGRPSRSSFDSAALDAYRFLCERYPDTPLGVIGESIGSGPASMLSSAQRPLSEAVEMGHRD